MTHTDLIMVRSVRFGAYDLEHIISKLSPNCGAHRRNNATGASLSTKTELHRLAPVSPLSGSLPSSGKAEAGGNPPSCRQPLSEGQS